MIQFIFANLNLFSRPGTSISNNKLKNVKKIKYNKKFKYTYINTFLNVIYYKKLKQIQDV